MLEELIVSDPNVMMGKPTIRGTRITVELILKSRLPGKLSSAFSKIIHFWPGNGS